jgi:hypothetical protein
MMMRFLPAHSRASDSHNTWTTTSPTYVGANHPRVANEMPVRMWVRVECVHRLVSGGYGQRLPLVRSD